jgi:hypothetical protein
VELAILREENDALQQKLKALEVQRSPSPLNSRSMNGHLPKLSVLRENHVDRLQASPTIPLSPSRSRRSLSHDPPSFLDQAPSPIQADLGVSLSSSLPLVGLFIVHATR